MAGASTHSAAFQGAKFQMCSLDQASEGQIP